MRRAPSLGTPRPLATLPVLTLLLISALVLAAAIVHPRGARRPPAPVPALVCGDSAIGSAVCDTVRAKDSTITFLRDSLRLRDSLSRAMARRYWGRWEQR